VCAPIQMEWSSNQRPFLLRERCRRGVPRLLRNSEVPAGICGLRPQHQLTREYPPGGPRLLASRANHEGEIDMNVQRHLLFLVTLAAAITPASGQQLPKTAALCKSSTA
jgi:hypothetical protein